MGSAREVIVRTHHGNPPLAAHIRLVFASILIVAIGATAAFAAEPRGSGQATADEAREFMETAEKELEDAWIRSSRASWIQSNFITDDTERLAAEMQEEAIALTTKYALEAARFDGLKLPADLARKLKLLKLSLSMPAPNNDAERTELTEIIASLESTYGKGKYCPNGEEKECLDLNDMTRILAESRDPDRLLDVWRGWRKISPPMRDSYRRFVELSNKGARELGFSDVGVMWRSNYDMPPDAFAVEIERLWEQVKPLYLALHAHVRASLAKKYGSDLVPTDGRIPAHLLGNMWSQTWTNIYPLVAPPEGDAGYNLTEILKARKLDARDMVGYGERFFTSLGFEPLPETFWKRSLFTKPADRDVVCHASAWDIDGDEDLRIKMCIEINDEDFSTIHHELGHNIYQRAYRHQSPLYQGSANDGFHEAIGDTIALSVTPAYLKKIDLLDRVPGDEGDLALLMKMALDKVAFLPFGLLVDQWRWKVFSGEIQPADYNESWWGLRRRYQGIEPPVRRTERDFDPGAKYHVPANVSYTRYFLATILQFQFHRALCEEAGYEGPLHRCSIYGNKVAGKKLQAMLEMGQSRPWPEALATMTGTDQLDATAILDYFAPLTEWLDEQNEGRKIGF
jgi:peptidyl-dipeptidase A